MSRAYTIIELLITMTIVALMAILGIVAFQNYGKGAIFQQASSEIEGLVNQVGLLARNPESDAKSYCLIVGDDKLSIYKGYDIECKNRINVREITLLSGHLITDKTEEVANRYLRCELLADDCFLKQTDESFNFIKLSEKKFLFRFSDSGSNAKDFFVRTNPYLVEVR